MMNGIEALNDLLVDEVVEDGYFMSDIKYKFVGEADVDGSITIEVHADCGEWLDNAEREGWISMPNAKGDSQSPDQ